MIERVVEADGDDPNANPNSRGHSSTDVNIHQQRVIYTSVTPQTTSSGSLESGRIDIGSLMKDVPKNADMHLAYATTDGRIMHVYCLDVITIYQNDTSRFLLRSTYVAV